MREARRGSGTSEDDDEDAYLTDSGIVARFFTNPVAVVLALFGVLSLLAAREAFGSITGGALSPVPAAAADWWRLHVSSWHPLGTGTDVPAPAYVLPFAFAATLLLGHTGAVVSGLMLLAVPVAAWGAWRLLKVVGRLVDPLGLPRWLRGVGCPDLRPRPGDLRRLGGGTLRHGGGRRPAAVDRARRPRLRRPGP